MVAIPRWFRWDFTLMEDMHYDVDVDNDNIHT
jgi:hypothetical protein